MSDTADTRAALESAPRRTLPRSPLDEAETALYDAITTPVNAAEEEFGAQWAAGYREGVEHALDLIRDPGPLAARFLRAAGHRPAPTTEENRP